MGIVISAAQLVHAMQMSLISEKPTRNILIAVIL
jgi:hypothetical protein